MKKSNHFAPYTRRAVSNLPRRQQPRQQSLFKAQKKYFGGVLLNGKRKSVRPLTSKDCIHFVLRSCWAVGKDSFLVKRNRNQVDLIINSFAKKFGVKIYQRAINSNHIHLLLKITNRVLYRAFIKAVTGKIASHVMGQQSFKLFSESRQNKSINSVAGDGSDSREQAPRKELGFWQYRPFSRIVNWGQDFKSCTRYLKQNVLEALGFVAYKTRKNYYAAELAEIYSANLGLLRIRSA